MNNERMNIKSLSEVIDYRTSKIKSDSHKRKTLFVLHTYLLDKIGDKLIENITVQDFENTITLIKSDSTLGDKSKKLYCSIIRSFQTFIIRNQERSKKEAVTESIENKDAQKIEQPQPELEPPQDAFNLNEWCKLRDNVCPNCMATPQKGKDGLLYVVCQKPKEWKEGKYGDWIPKGGSKGKIPIEICQSTQARLIKSKLKTVKDPDFKEVTNQPDKDKRIAGLEDEIRHLRQRIKELEPFESALLISKQRDRERNYITRLLTPSLNLSFKCWKGTSTLENCLKNCGSYETCKDRLSHEPTIITLSYIEKQLRNRKYCPQKEQFISEHDCLFECQDHEKCEKFKQDPTLLKERIEKITDLYLDTMHPFHPKPSIETWAKQEQRIEQPLEPTQPLEPPDPLDTENMTLDEIEKEFGITYIDPETAKLTIEQFEEVYGLNDPLEDEELDIAELPKLEMSSNAESLQECKALEPSPNTETFKPTTIEDPHNIQTPQEPKPLEEAKSLEELSPQIIIWQIQCPRDKTQKIRNECLSSCKVWKRALCSEYQKFPQTLEDLAFKNKTEDTSKLKK